MRLALRLLALPLAIAGCGMSSDPGTPMTTHMGMVTDDLASVMTESGTHKTAVAGAAKVTDLPALESAHLAKITPYLDDTKTMCVLMKDTCMNAAGLMADTKPMADLADQMKQEWANHNAAMAAAADLAAAATEETRHQAAVADFQAKMSAKQAALAPTEAGYTCTPHMH